MSYRDEMKLAGVLVLLVACGGSKQEPAPVVSNSAYAECAAKAMMAGSGATP